MSDAPNRSSEELAMRDLVVPELRRRWPTARIIHELPTRYSSNRIDLAAVTEDVLIGVEIKSSRDVIDRLEAQLRAFEPICHGLLVCLAPKWNLKLPSVERKTKLGTAFDQQWTEAQEVVRRVSTLIPIWTVDAAAGAVDSEDGWILERRYLQERKPWSAKMLDVLHVSELVRVAERHQIATGRRDNHSTLVRACHDMMRPPEISRAVCRALRERSAFCAGTDAPIMVAA
jgi:hypothetical protein